jgi:DNA-binding transcriptional MerR regulator
MASRTSRAPAPKRRRKPADKPADTELVKMSELAKRSGVPAPTIKHYIREGLLPGPQIRTSRNMAYYDARLAARIRVIKELQAERFLPLRVIVELLDPAPSDKIRPDRDAAQRKALTALAPVVGGHALVERRKRSEVMKTFGVSRAELDSLENAGVLDLHGEGETAGYSGLDLSLLDLLAETRRLGLGALFPISIAEPYMLAVKKLVEFEIDMFRHRALGAPLPASLGEVAKVSIELGARLITALRAKIMPAALARLGQPE